MVWRWLPLQLLLLALLLRRKCFCNNAVKLVKKFMRIESVVSLPPPLPLYLRTNVQKRAHTTPQCDSWQTVRPEPVIDGYGLLCFVCVCECEWCARTRCVSLRETFPLFPMCTFREYCARPMLRFCQQISTNAYTVHI